MLKKSGGILLIVVVTVITTTVLETTTGAYHLFAAGKGHQNTAVLCGKGQHHGVIGTVTAINGSSITVSPVSVGHKGNLVSSATTVVTTNGTKFAMPGSSSADLSAIKVGSWILATGTLSSDGKTLTANRIIVEPAGFKPGSHAEPHFFGPMMGRGIFGLHHAWRIGGFWGMHRLTS